MLGSRSNTSRTSRDSDSYHIISHHIKSNQIKSNHIISYQIISYHIISSNSGLIKFAHVLNLIVNQSCHALAGGKLRDPAGAVILASLTREATVELSGQLQSPLLAWVRDDSSPSLGHGGGNCVDAALRSLTPSSCGSSSRSSEI